MEEVRDDDRIGRETTIKSPEMVKNHFKNVWNKIAGHQSLLISKEFYISYATANAVVTEDLKMTKMCTKFDPKLPREDQRKDILEASMEVVNLWS